jgi:hypothetical protein
MSPNITVTLSNLVVDTGTIKPLDWKFVPLSELNVHRTRTERWVIIQREVELQL